MTEDLSKEFHVLASSPHHTTYELKRNNLKVTIVPAPSPFNSLHTQVVFSVGSADELVGFTGSTVS